MPIACHTPTATQIVQRTAEASHIVTLSLELLEHPLSHFSFTPGQFNMLYLFGIGEVAISISFVHEQSNSICHTIRAVGRVTKKLAQLAVGSTIGLRGPFGVGWPMDAARNKDILIITGGLGCAPSMSVVHHALKHRADYGKLYILQGIKHSDDLIFDSYYQAWKQAPNTEVHLAADHSTMAWPWYRGRVTELLDELEFQTDNTIVMCCGPEPMMKSAAKKVFQLGVKKSDIYLSLERNMSCALGQCGHCQMGPYFVCKDGPVFSYDQVESLLELRGI